MRRIRNALKSVCLGLISLAPLSAGAGEIVQLGYGRLINNDFLGDLKDRGQTGSYASSRILGKAWAHKLPSKAGELLEFRFQADIKAPDNLTSPAAGDRPFAGSLSIGLHTHYQRHGYEMAFGGELTATGPQTGLDQFQTALHDGLSVAPPSSATRGSQIGNDFFPGVVVEVGRSFTFGKVTQFRPFLEARAGVETLFRAGADFEFGRRSGNDMLVRDGISGQRYRAILSGKRSLSFVVGGDVAVVSESAYLPSKRGYTLTDHRDRARAGVRWQGGRSHGFFGVTYLGQEYTSQTSGQVIGSVRLALKF